MDSKSWTTTSAGQCQASNGPLGRHTDPIIYVVEDGSNGDKTSKRKSEESLERPSKRSRTSVCSSYDSWRHLSIRTPISSSSSDSSVLAGCLPDCRSDESKKTSKRKSEESLERPSKRSRTDHSPSEGCRQMISWSSMSVSSDNTEATWETELGSKKTESTTPSIFRDTGGPRKRRRQTSQSPKAAFEAKYEEDELLGEGGFGSVFAGYRKDDNLPVAVKHVPQVDVLCTSMLLDGEIRTVPLEVALLLKLKPAAGETSAAVHLLDWYDLDNELILVLERPVPCMDLLDYINSTGSSLQEYEAKIITKQLVDALIEVHSRGVFHRDIKLDNILIETGSDVPRPRIIDFGCGTFLSEGMYTGGQGTLVYTSPEWFLDERYRAEPTTVWQVGVVLFAALHGHLPFETRDEIVSENPDVTDNLSFDCQGFLRRCLTKSPEARPTLDTLKHHPWLM